jgi:hypothetical protein
MIICAAGDIHGALDRMYKDISKHDRRRATVLHLENARLFARSRLSLRLHRRRLDALPRQGAQEAQPDPRRSGRHRWTA